MTKKALIWVAILIAGPSGVLAQEEIRSLEPGQRVRINGEIEGHFRAVTNDSFIFGNDRLPVEGVTQLEAFSLESITRLEVLAGQRRATKKGAVIGALVLGIPSVFVAEAMADFCIFCGQSHDELHIGAAFGGLVVGGAIGAGVGALIGAAFKSDRWEDVSLDRVGMTLIPRLDGGLALGMRLSF